MLKGMQLLLTCRQWLLELRATLCESDESRSGRAEVYFHYGGPRRRTPRSEEAPLSAPPFLMNKCERQEGVLLYSQLYGECSIARRPRNPISERGGGYVKFWRQ